VNFSASDSLVQDRKRWRFTMTDQKNAPTTPAKPKESGSRQQRHADQSQHAPQPSKVGTHEKSGASSSTVVPPNAK